MTLQRFQGDIEGFYVGEPDVSGFARASAKSKHFRLRIYRAVVRHVKLLEAPTTTGLVTTSGPTMLPETSPEPIPPPREPLPPGTFAQDVVSDARLTPVRHRAGWFEGPIHDVRVADFRSTHQKRTAGRIYGRFVGRVTGHFALPPPPLPPPAEALLAELSAPPEPRDGVPAVSGLGEAPPAGPAAGDETGDAPDHEDELPLAAGAKTSPKAKSQAPLLLLVAAFTIALVALCSPSRAVIWLVFLLPTLLVRRILRGALAESAGVRAFGTVSVLGQLACAGFLGVSFWATGCKELSFLPVAGLVLGVFVTSVLPSNLPLLVNGAALGLVLTTWCSAFGKRCAEPTPAAAITNRPTAHDPGVPRTNADGSWPRVPPRAPRPTEKKP